MQIKADNVLNNEKKFVYVTVPARAEHLMILYLIKLAENVRIDLLEEGGESTSAWSYHINMIT